MRPLCLLVFASCFSANLFADIVDSGAGFSSAIETTAVTLAGGNPPTVVADQPPEIIVLNSTAHSYSADQTAAIGGVTGSVSVNISPGGGNVGLHGFAASDAPSVFGSDADFDMYWYDLFHITGTGAETFEYTLTLDGNLIPPTNNGLAGSLAFGSLSLYANSSYQTWGIVTADAGCTNYCGLVSSVSLNASETSGSTITGDLSLYGGENIELGLFLLARTGAGNPNGSANIFAEFNAANTGFFTLTPITPGASFTTASGLTYASNPELATPEPAYGLLCCFGIAGILCIRRFRNRVTPAL